MQSDSGSAGPTGTVTFLITDIEGSTLLLQRTGAAFPDEAVESHEQGGIYIWRLISLTSRANMERMAGNRAMALKYYLDALDRAPSHGMRFYVSRSASPG
jgi:hypothetical protein